MVKRNIMVLLILIFTWTSLPISTISAATDSTFTNTYFIKFKDSKSGIISLGDKLIHSYEFLPLALAELTQEELILLLEDPNVEYIELDSFVEASSEISFSPSILHEQSPEQLELPNEEITASKVKIAVLDTGISLSAIPNVKSKNSFIDDNLSNESLNNHGTYVASIINQLAPNVELFDLQVLDHDGVGAYSHVIEAIEWAIENEMDIVQMSFGGQAHSLAMAEAMLFAEEQGIMLVAAAGNGSAFELDFPAKYNSVIAVGAIDDQNERLFLSNRGNELEFVALGQNVNGAGLNGETVQLIGTSTAVSHVVGVAALYMEHFPTLSATAIREVMRTTAVPLGAVDEYGYGKVAFEIEEQGNKKIEEEHGNEEIGLEKEEELPEGIDSLKLMTPEEQLLAERIQKIINGESLIEDSLEEIGEYRLQDERAKLELDRKINIEMQRLEQEKAKLTVDELITEFDLDPVAIQEMLDEGFTVQELYQYYWDYRESNAVDTSLQKNLSSMKRIPPTKRELVNLADSAISEIEVNIGSELIIEDQPTIEDIDFEKLKKFERKDHILERKAIDDSDILSDEELISEDENSSEEPFSFELSTEEDDSLTEISNEESYSVELSTVGDDSPSEQSGESTYSLLNTEEEIIKPVERSSEAPYSVGLYNESVSLLTGGVTVQESDFTLPGRGGLSFTLSRTYSSNNSQLDEMDVGYTYDYEYFYDYAMTYNERPIYHNLTRTYTRTLTKYACVNGVRSGSVLWSDSAGTVTDAPLRYNTEQSAMNAYNNPPGKSSTTVHSCGSKPDELNRMYQYEYTHNSSSLSESYGGWSPSYGASYEGPFSTFEEANIDRVKMMNGIYNESQQKGGSYSGGYYQYSMTFTPNPSGVYSVSSISSSYNKISPDPLDKRFPIGKGWTWDIPYVKIDGSKKYVGLGDGSTYEISGTQLKNYTWSDLSFVNDTTVSYNGKTSAFALKSVYGTHHYFDADGNLIMIKDAYNNKTSFAYSNVSPYGEVLTKITDAADNSIAIQYTSNQVILTSDGRTVKYTKTTSNGKELLSQVSDPLNRITTYSYTISPAKFNLKGSTPTQSNPYALLKAIQHPTGAKTVYTYETNPVKRFMKSNQVNEAYRLASRIDEVTYSDQTTETFNYASLVYSTDMGATYGSDATITTTLFNNLLETKETYLKKFVNNTVGHDYYLTKRSVNDGTIEQNQTFTHDQSKRRIEPISISQSYKNVTTQATTIPVTTSRVFDNFKNVTSETNAHGLVSTYTYHATTHRLVSATEPVTGTQSIYTEVVSRNANGDVTEQRLRLNNASGTILQHVQYQFDPYGNITLIRQKESNRDLDTKITYSDTYKYAYPTLITRPYTDVHGYASEQKISATYHKARGTMASFTDGKNLVTNYSYDALDRLTLIKHPDTSQYSISYFDALNEVKETNEDGIQTYTKWNPFGLQIEQGFLINNNKMAKVKTGYDSYTRPVWNEDALANRTVTQYDNWNRITAVILSGNIRSTVSFNDLNFTTETTNIEGTTIRETADRFGRVIRKELKNNNAYLTQWIGSYDVSDRLLSVQDGKNYITTYSYDPFGRITKVTGADQSSYQYEYNRQGQMTAMVSPKEDVTSKRYDQIGRLISTTDPLGKRETYEYDKNHNLIRYTDKKGQIFTHTYNNRNFLTAKSGPSESVQYTYNASGTRKTMQDNGSRITSYYYDHYGQLDYLKYPDGKTIHYNYDAAGKLENIITPFLDEIDYGYDTANRMQMVKWNGTNQATYNYSMNKPLQSVVQANGITINHTYDGANRLQDLTHKLGSVEQRKYSQSYDGNSNIQSIKEFKSGVQNASHSFTYDVMNRISTSSLYNETYAYDSNGNRQSVTSANNAYFPSAASYEYDQWNRLKKVTTEDNKVVEYVYNGDDLLVERKENGVTTRYYYDGGNMIGEGIVGTGNSVTPKASYLYGSTGLIMREDEVNQSKAYYLTNGHGDVTEIRNASGAVLNSYTYDIWGNIINQTGSLDNPFLYSGEYWDNTTNLQYLRARWYDPSMGRFINEDTYEGELNNPLSLNLYTYVLNNPLKYIDPSGHKVWLIHGTFSDTDKSWGKVDGDFVNYIKGLFKEPVQRLAWSGENNETDRAKDADKLAEIIYNYHILNTGEPIRLVGHSHGGNVAILITNLLAEKGLPIATLITIATPVREYQVKTTVGEHINVYNEFDDIQTSGGRKGNLLIAGRTFDDAENVMVTLPMYRRNTWYGISNHSYMHRNVKVWKEYLEPVLGLSTKGSRGSFGSGGSRGSF